MLALLQQNNPKAAAKQVNRPVNPAEEERVDFVKAVLGDTEDVWDELFHAMNREYQKPKLVLFSDGVPTEGCGFASSAVGPFYCPRDTKGRYLDIGFFEELRTTLQGARRLRPGVCGRP